MWPTIIVGAAWVAFFCWIWWKTHRKRKVKVVWLNEAGEEVMDIRLKVGESKAFRALLKRLSDGSIDDSYQNPLFTYGADASQDIKTALDGSSFITVHPTDPLTIKVTRLAGSPVGGDGNQIPSPVSLFVDSDAGPGVQLINGSLNVTCDAEENAGTVEFEEVPLF